MAGTPVWRFFTTAVDRLALHLHQLEFRKIPEYLRAILLKRAGIRAQKLPQIEAKILHWDVTASFVQNYSNLCGHIKSHPLFLTFMHCPTASLVPIIISHPEFPLNVLGSVATGMKIVQYRPGKVQPGDKFSIVAQLQPYYRIARRGIEFDIVLKALDQTKQTVWQSIFSALVFMNTSKVKESNPLPPISSTESAEDYANLPIIFTSDIMKVPYDAGKKYAALCGDYNPIHISALAAKLFGFKNAVAHGMCVVSMCLERLQDCEEFKELLKFYENNSAKENLSLEVKFKRPVLLGENIHFTAKKHSKNRIILEVFGNGQDKPSITGSISINTLAQIY